MRWIQRLATQVLALGLIGAFALGFSGMAWSLPSAASLAQANTSPAPVDQIHDLQDKDHLTAFNQQPVADIPGIVTAVQDKGFYMQAPIADEDAATSEGIFVFTNGVPQSTDAPIAVGDRLAVSGLALEYFPGGRRSNNLPMTEIDASGASARITRLASDEPLPEPVILGRGGRIPPTQTIDDDGMIVFDPQTDGLDFYESLEGMRVQVNDPVVVGPTNRFGEWVVLGDNGKGASVRTAAGGIIVRPGDFNPERIVIKNTMGETPQVHVGDRFDGPIIGVMGYSYGNFKLFNTELLPAVIPAEILRETTELLSSADQLTIATFNVQNLDPSDRDRLEIIGQLLANNLASPDILALVEVQDNNGADKRGGTEADATYQGLIESIAAADGPTYQFTDISPEPGLDGGQPGGNIRVGFLYRPDRVSLADHPKGRAAQAVAVKRDADGPTLSLNPGRIDPINEAFDDSRKPLAAEFLFNGQRVFVIANHFNSKGGDEALFGFNQPPKRPTEVQRHQQAKVVQAFVKDLLNVDPDANVIVLGDLNDFQFSDTLTILAGCTLQSLVDYLPPSDRYTYIYEGNAQLLDHILVSQHPLFDAEAEFDIVHLNAGLPNPVSDHDPLVVRLTLPAGGASGPGETPASEPEVAEPSEPEGTLVLFPSLTGTPLLNQLVTAYAPQDTPSYAAARDVPIGRKSCLSKYTLPLEQRDRSGGATRIDLYVAKQAFNILMA